MYSLGMDVGPYSRFFPEKNMMITLDVYVWNKLFNMGVQGPQLTLTKLLEHFSKCFLMKKQHNPKKKKENSMTSWCFQPKTFKTTTITTMYGNCSLPLWSAPLAHFFQMYQKNVSIPTKFVVDFCFRMVSLLGGVSMDPSGWRVSLPFCGSVKQWL